MNSVLIIHIIKKKLSSVLKNFEGYLKYYTKLVIKKTDKKGIRITYFELS